MNGTGSKRVRRMLKPPHLGELAHESMDEVGWSVTEAVPLQGCKRGTLSRRLNGNASASAFQALVRKPLVEARLIIGCGCRRAMTSRRNEARGQGRSRPAFSHRPGHPAGVRRKDVVEVNLAAFR